MLPGATRLVARHGHDVRGVRGEHRPRPEEAARRRRGRRQLRHQPRDGHLRPRRPRRPRHRRGHPGCGVRRDRGPEPRGSGLAALGARGCGAQGLETRHGELEDVEQQRAATASTARCGSGSSLGTALAVPVVVLGMAHLQFPGVNWLQLALATPVLLFCGLAVLPRRVEEPAPRHGRHEHADRRRHGRGVRSIRSPRRSRPRPCPPTRTSPRATRRRRSTSRRPSSSSSWCWPANCSRPARAAARRKPSSA